MTKIFLLPLLLLSPGGGRSRHYDDGGSAVLANGFTSTPPSSSAHSSSLSFDRTQRQRAFLPRGGASNAPSSSSSSLASTASIESDAGPALEVISQSNWDLLSDRGRAALTRLISYDVSSGHDGQRHVYGDWPEAGVDDEGKRMLGEQLADLDGSYPGGLPAYLSKAKTLLQESADGSNPFAEFEASVPEGESLSYEDPNADSHTGMSFTEAETAGLTGIGDTAFVLVAGGLGERLGYSGIKLSLETNLLTNKSYLEVYAKYIQAMQRMAHIATGKDHIRIPLVIMTSGDTDPATRKLLQDNANFGFDDDQVSIVKQDKVAALSNGNAGLSMKSQWEVETKPHGHGDVHHLLYREGYVDKWAAEGRKHVVFLQDTNALVINSVLPTLGVSIAKGFHMNSICIPRLAGEAAGAIARLEHKTDPEKVRRPDVVVENLWKSMAT